MKYTIDNHEHKYQDNSSWAGMPEYPYCILCRLLKTTIEAKNQTTENPVPSKSIEQPTSWETEFDKDFSVGITFTTRGHAYALKEFIRKTITQEKRKELLYIRDHSSGGGSWRRVIEIRLGKLEYI